MDSEFWRDVGGLKAVHHRASLADCFALALTRPLGDRLVTADRHEGVAGIQLALRDRAVKGSVVNCCVRFNFYSARITTVGSTRTARRAGNIVPTSVIINARPIAAANVNASAGLTPASKASIIRPAP